MKFSRNPKHPMWNCDQSILVSIRWGSHNISQWWILEVVICRNLWKWRHIYVSHHRKSINCFCPCYHLVVFGWHTFFGEVFLHLSLSLSFSPYMRMYLCTCTSNPCGDIALILACFSPTASRIGRVRRDHAPCKTEPVQLEDVCTHKGGQAGKPAGWEDEAKSAWCMEGFHHSRIPPIFGPARAS